MIAAQRRTVPIGIGAGRRVLTKVEGDVDDGRHFTHDVRMTVRLLIRFVALTTCVSAAVCQLDGLLLRPILLSQYRPLVAPLDPFTARRGHRSTFARSSSNQFSTTTRSPETSVALAR